MAAYKATFEQRNRSSNKQMKKVDYSDISIEMIRQNRKNSQQVGMKSYTRNTNFQGTSEIVADARMGSIDTNFKQ